MKAGQPHIDRGWSVRSRFDMGDPTKRLSSVSRKIPTVDSARSRRYRLRAWAPTRGAISSAVTGSPPTKSASRSSAAAWIACETWYPFVSRMRAAAGVSTGSGIASTSVAIGAGCPLCADLRRAAGMSRALQCAGSMPLFGDGTICTYARWSTAAIEGVMTVVEANRRCSKRKKPISSKVPTSCATANSTAASAPNLSFSIPATAGSTAQPA